MLEVAYMVALIVGGGLVLVSSLAGSVGDADIDADADVDLDAGLELSTDLDAHAEVPDLGGLAVFFKFKFWTFFLAFGGLTGFVLLKLGVGQFWTIAPALVMGILCGFLMSWSLEKLKKSQRGSQASVATMIGREAVVRIPVLGSTPGKVRLNYGGRNIDMIAISDMKEPIDEGERVVIVSSQGGKLCVMTREYLTEGEDAPKA